MLIFGVQLIKSLFDLFQTSRQWYVCLITSFNFKGYCHSLNDYSIFYKKAGDFVTLVVVYADDTLLTGNNVAELNDLNMFLDSEFKIKDLGHVSFFGHGDSL